MPFLILILGQIVIFKIVHLSGSHEILAELIEHTE